VVFCLIILHLLLNIIKPADFINLHVNTNILDRKLNLSFDKWKDVAAYPWLFRKESEGILFADLCNDLDKLLSVMSNKTNKIALLRFNYPWQTMLQNQIYTLVKFGQVYNYIVMTGDEKSLRVCFELNLPCFNGSRYFQTFYKNIDPTIDAIITDRKNYRPLQWFKLRFFFDVLIRNYTILAFDTDIAFSRKNIWLSLEKYSEDVGNCDMVFMLEHPINAGFLYSKSNSDTLTLFQEWISMEYTYPDFDEQKCFGLMQGTKYEICETKDQCTKIKLKKMINFNTSHQNALGAAFVSLRRFPSAYSPYTKSHCPTSQKVDPCLNTSLFIHPICIIGRKVKIQKLMQNGFWLMEEPCNRTTSYYQSRSNNTVAIDIYQCRPKIFEDPNAENEFEKCRNTIAWSN
jgi:hypothetical protein